jgi:two-component system NtrC family sensor kinase
VPINAPQCASCHPGGVGTPARLPAPGSRVTLDRQRMIASAVTPILNEPACSRSSCHPGADDEPVLGLLEVDLSYAAALAAQRAYWLRMGLLALALIAATSAVVFLLIRRWVSRPVALLVEGTRSIARGDLDHQIPETGGELGDLARAFNAMQARISSTQRQIIASEKLASVGKLAAGVAHEINNPLTGILTFAEELHDDLEPDDPAVADLAVIRDEALRCREIVRGLLDYSRQKEPSLQRVQVTVVIQSTLKLVARLAQFHDVKIEHAIPAELPAVMGDPGQLQQVILNLLVNAAEAMPAGGTLTIDGAEDSVRGLGRLTITDTGHGIPQDHLDQIFEPFYSTKEGKTSGLGLAVSWAIVERHGGSLEVGSTGLQGTTFVVNLKQAAQS